MTGRSDRKEVPDRAHLADLAASTFLLVHQFCSLSVSCFGVCNLRVFARARISNEVETTSIVRSSCSLSLTLCGPPGRMKAASSWLLRMRKNALDLFDMASSKPFRLYHKLPRFNMHIKAKLRCCDDSLTTAAALKIMPIRPAVHSSEKFSLASCSIACCDTLSQHSICAR